MLVSMRTVPICVALLVLASSWLPATAAARPPSPQVSAMAAEPESSDDSIATAAVTRDRRDRHRSCNQRFRQLVHFDDVALRAKEQGKQMWEDATHAHITHLESELERRCPEEYDRRMDAKATVKFWRATKEMMRMAAEGAKSFFTGGLAP